MQNMCHDINFTAKIAIPKNSSEITQKNHKTMYYSRVLFQYTKLPRVRIYE